MFVVLVLCMVIASTRSNSLPSTSELESSTKSNDSIFTIYFYFNLKKSLVQEIKDTFRSQKPSSNTDQEAQLVCKSLCLNFALIPGRLIINTTWKIVNCTRSDWSQEKFWWRTVGDRANRLSELGHFGTPWICQS